MPKVELISNITHSYYTALSLERAGYLSRYITGPCALDSEAWIGRLGGPLSRLWSERRLGGLPQEKVRRNWLPELVQKGVRRSGGTSAQSNWMHNELFGRWAASILEECDAVHFIHSVGREAARKAKRNGAKVVCDIREEHPQFQEDILSEEARRLGVEFVGTGASYRRRVLDELDLADTIFCPSGYAKRTLVSHGIPEEKIVVCPYGADCDMFAPSAPPKGVEPFTALFLGNVCARKGVQYLLQGFAQAKLKGARLLLAGPVDPAFRPVLAQYEGLFEEVGRVKHDEVASLYRQADVFLVPSLADAGPLVALEAMASGLPVVVSENTGASEVISHAVDGFVVPIRDARAIADILVDLYENRDRRAAIGASAAARAREANWATYQRRCAEIYDRLFKAPAVCSAEERAVRAAS